jgi:hypothetical protein
MDSTIIAAIISGVAILLAAIIPILRNKPGQKKLTRARLSIWGITALAVGAIWLLLYFYINRDIAGNKTNDILNGLIEKRDGLDDRIRSIHNEYISISERASVAEAERQRNGNIQKQFVIVTKELIEKSKLAKGDILTEIDDLGKMRAESSPLFSIIRDQNMQAGDKIELPGYDPNVEAAALMGRRDALYNVLKDLREQVKALDEQITALASSKAH